MLQHSRSDTVFDALGDANRRAILERLSRGPASVSSLAEPLGVTVAAALQHVQLLERAGLVSTRKEGRVRICKLDGDGLEVASQWIEARRREQERRLDRLAEVLGEGPGSER